MDTLIQEIQRLAFRLVNSDSFMHDAALFLGVFFALWLTSTTGPGFGALIAAIAPALSSTVRYFLAKAADKRIKS